MVAGLPKLYRELRSPILSKERIGFFVGVVFPGVLEMLGYRWIPRLTRGCSALNNNSHLFCKVGF